MEVVYLANDKYSAALTAGYTAGQNTLYVNNPPNNVPTIVVAAKGTDDETVFSVTGKTVNSLTGVERLRGANVDLDTTTPITCLNNEEFINQFASKIDPFSFQERATAPTTPDAGTALMYLKDDGKFYYIDDAGDEHLLIEEAVDPALLTEQGSTPATPAANKMLLYPKTDNQIYTLDDSGTERLVGSTPTLWNTISDTLVYVNANQVKIEGVDRTSTYKKGTKIKITQTTDKYFYVSADATLSGSDTIIPVYAGADYTVANAAITSPQYSYADRPLGFPTSFSFDLAPFGSGGSIGSFAQTSNAARFSWTAGLVHVWGAGKVTNKGSWSGSVYHNLPIMPSGVVTVSGGKWLIEGGLNTLKAMAANVNTSPSAILQWNKTFLTAEFGWSDMAVNDCYQVEFSYPA